MRVLAIETSCDETSIAVVEGNNAGPFRVLSNVVYSQLDLHRQYGGVYPELASREHVAKIQPVLEQALAEAAGFFENSKLEYRNSKQIQNPKKRKTKNFGFRISDFGFSHQAWIKSQIDVVAVTVGPGLIGSLLVGVNLAKTLAYVFQKPILGINHHEGHIAAAWLQVSRSDSKYRKIEISKVPADAAISNSQFLISNSPPQRDPATAGQTPNPKSENGLGPTDEEGMSAIPNTHYAIPKPPTLALVVSGGHTQLVMVRDVDEYEVIGRTRDDAAGEAFDKVARLLNLGYPGGPAIAAAALEISKFRHVDISRLPRPMLDSNDFDFSFSGIKTAVARLAHLERPLTRAKKIAIAHEFQEAVVEVLVTKTLRAVSQFRPKSVILCGGVAANQLLREKLIRESQISNLKSQIFIPPLAYCTDNAAMIGAAALRRALAGQVGNWYDIHADESLRLGAKPS